MAPVALDSPENLPSTLPSTPAGQGKGDGLAATDGPASCAQIEQEASVFFPLTEEQIKAKKSTFIDSIDQDAVCLVASKFCGGGTCSIIDEKKGSFNICFFVRFESNNKTWVLRIPIVPVVPCCAWDKLLSEVTTMRYIESKTTIRIPYVHAYGKDDTLVQGSSTPFMIMEFIPGRQLNTKTWMHTTELQRRNLYIDLINAFTQLRKLEFPAAGSLIPNPNDELNPILGPFLSITARELERSCGTRATLAVLTSTAQFVDYHSNILSATAKEPVQDDNLDGIKTELFALDSILNEIPRCIDLQEPGPFVLAHADLRCGNLLVDDDFHILAIIDWEFSGSIPLQLFTPPPWIMGHDPATSYVYDGISGRDIFPEFRTVLMEMRKSSSACTQLCHDWEIQGQAAQDGEFVLKVSPIMEIFRHPSRLCDIYYMSVFERLFGFNACKDIVVDDFFEKDENQALAQRAELQMRNSKRYTKYLVKHGLFVEDPRAQKIQEFLEKTKHLVKDK
ncbi:hypothetical protein HIM_11895 [Hirsutella minnesotensis 3608]|uniref:Aminoglycoside phosphotransferase domain-containing protein n=1 Tax=Hirsutella minnesotensis 3608 TaxID=1043627 RepID=A0A0F7ZWC2_9HYPO|nr:hypothetical protein HIM_11895 [Hirsutella minnesotensis 3608]